jgi:hypothetical protein
MEMWDPVTGKGRFFSDSGNAVTQQALSVPTYTFGSNNNQTQLTVFANASPTSSWFINYWISVTPTKIVIVLRGDPANTGVINMLTFQKTTALTSNEKNTWQCFCSTSFTYCALNSGMALISGRYVYDSPYWGRTTFGTNSNYQESIWTATTQNSQAQTSCNLSYITPLGSNPLGADGKWWLSTLYSYTGRGGADTAGGYTSITRTSGWKGKIRGIWAISSDNWSSLDELVDGVNTYLLVTLTSNLANTGATSYAILEE